MIRLIKTMLLFIIMLSFVGCTNEKKIETESKETRERIEIPKQLSIQEGIKSIRIIKYVGHQSVEWKDKDTVEEIKKIMLEAERIEGTVNIANPEYNVIITYNNKQKDYFELRIGGDGYLNTWMSSEDTNYIYSNTKVTTKNLNKLLKESNLIKNETE